LVCLHLYPRPFVPTSSPHSNSTSLRPDPYSSHPPRSRKDPPTSRFQALQIERLGMVHDLSRRRTPRRLLRLVTHIRGLLLSRRRKIWLLRGIQISVWREDVPGGQQAYYLPRCQCECGVSSGHCIVSVRGCKGPDADYVTAVCTHHARGDFEGCSEGGICWVSYPLLTCKRGEGKLLTRR